MSTNILAAAYAGVLSAFVTHPLDLLKVQQQAATGTSLQSSPTGWVHFFASRAREDGIASWWRGSTPALVRVSIYTVMQCTVYTSCKQTCKEATDWPTSGLRNQIMSSLVSGVVTTAFINPFDVLKTRMLVKENHPIPSHLAARQAMCNLISIPDQICHLFFASLVVPSLCLPANTLGFLHCCPPLHARLSPPRTHNHKRTLKVSPWAFAPSITSHLRRGHIPVGRLKRVFPWLAAKLLARRTANIIHLRLHGATPSLGGNGRLLVKPRSACVLPWLSRSIMTMTQPLL